jgi:ankyrin repeat protein
MAYYCNMMLKRNYFFAILGLILAVLPAFADEIEEKEPLFPPCAIINASYRGDLKSIQEILDAGVDPDVRDAMGATALHEAMLQPNTTVVKLLLDNGFDPNARATKNGYTPLHFAVAANNIAAAKLLLQYGADKRISCLKGMTPLDIARQSDKGAFISLLR